LKLVEDLPYSETSLAYNPLNGQPDKANYGYAGNSSGVFAQDTWKTTRSLTLTLGLPGWIVGMAGAMRYPLPENWKDAKAAEPNVYGFLLARVSPDGEIQFDFHRLEEKDIPAPLVSRFKPEFVHWCFAENSTAQQRSFVHRLKCGGCNKTNCVSSGSAAIRDRASRRTPAV